MASMQVRRLRRSPRGSAGAGRRRGEPGAAVPPGACVRPSVRACVTRREERRGGRNRPGRAEGVELPGSGAGEGRWRQGRAGPAPGWR